MPKRRRLFTPNKYKIKTPAKTILKTEGDSEVTSARGRFKGALLDALDPAMPIEGESDGAEEPSPVKRERQSSTKEKEFLTDEEAKSIINPEPPKASYVLKLFDRSVDLSQFRDDSPLYPICRAWIANQPKANYSEFGSEDKDKQSKQAGGLALPAPEGPPVAKVPALLPEQLASSKDNIHLDYGEDPELSREQILRMHMPRWAAVRQAWQDQANKAEIRYEATQRLLNQANLEFLR